MGIFTPIPEQNLENLLSYKHQSAMPGWLDNEIMTPFWNALVEYVPWNVHPNVLTMVGNSANLLATYLTLQNCGGIYELNCGKHEAPRWHYFVVAFCFFTWQTLDALDGKQARRTKVGSPFGQLWDHGWDAFTWPHFFLSLAAGIDMGLSWRFYVFVGLVLAAAYLAYWEQRNCGPLRWAEGTTEGQFIAMFALIAVGIFGSAWTAYSPKDVWIDCPDIIAGITVIDLVVIFGAKDPVVNSLSSFRYVWNSSVRSNTVIREIFWFFLLFACTLFCVNTPIGNSNITLLFICFNLAYSHMVNKLTVYDVTKLDYDLVEFAVIPFPILSLICSGKIELLDSRTVFGCCVLFIFLLWFSFAFNASRQILTKLNKRMWVVTTTRESVLKSKNK